MARMVFCKKLGKGLRGLGLKPFNNDLGQRIYDNISQDAWKMWLEHFKMIMNEYRLSPADPRTNEILFDQAEQFFFGEGAQLPPDYQPPRTKGQRIAQRAATLARLAFPVPDGALLPGPERYARLADADGSERLAGYAEATRGCKHLCRHCPIPALYGGRFFPLPIGVLGG